MSQATDTDRAVKVGDVVAWADVPDGVLVRSESVRDYAARVDGFCHWMSDAGGREWRDFGVGTPWDENAEDDNGVPIRDEDDTRFTIVALGLTGQESADDLRRLAEVFEVREALRAAKCSECDAACECWGICEGAVETLAPMCGEHCGHGGEEGWCTMSGPKYDEHMHALAERLHAAGWRSGMTVEDAARRLAEADR